MKVTVASLCDAATMREGLLHMLGGGISVMPRPMFPAPLAANLALAFIISPDDEGKEHQIEISLSGDTASSLSSIKFSFVPDRSMLPESDVPDDADLVAPIVLPTGGFVLPSPGRFSLSIRVDGEEAVALPVTAIQIVPDPAPAHD